MTSNKRIAYIAALFAMLAFIIYFPTVVLSAQGVESPAQDSNSIWDSIKEFLRNWGPIIGIGISLVGLWFFFCEIRKSGKVTRNDFNMGLSERFEKNMKLYKKLDEIHREYIGCRKSGKGVDHIIEEKFKKGNEIISSEAQDQMSDYLNFFDNIYNLLKSRIIKIRDFDDQYGYKFFIAVNNCDVQTYMNNFRFVNDNTFKLYMTWVKYRINSGIGDPRNGVMQIGNRPLCSYEKFENQFNDLKISSIDRLYHKIYYKITKKRIEKSEIAFRLKQVYDSRYKGIYNKIMNGQIPEEEVFEYYLSFFSQTRKEFIDKDLISEEDIKNLISDEKTAKHELNY